MAFSTDLDGNYAVNDDGSFVVDDGATLDLWNPITEVSEDNEVEVAVEAGPELVMVISAVGNPSEGSITWALSGPDATDFTSTDNGNGTVSLRVIGGITAGFSEVTVTADNGVGSDSRMLLITATAIPIGGGSSYLFGTLFNLSSEIDLFDLVGGLNLFSLTTPIIPPTGTPYGLPILVAASEPFLSDDPEQ